MRTGLCAGSTPTRSAANASSPTAGHGLPRGVVTDFALFMDLTIFLARHTQSIRLAVKTTHWPDGRIDSNDRCSAGVPIDPMTVAAAGIRCQSLSNGGELPC